MGRVNKYAAGLSKDRWETFGKRLEMFRGLSTSLTQAQVAAAVGVSRRQWIRYTKGAPVPLERIPKIAKVLGMSVGRALLHAGYEPKERGVDADAHLRLIRDYVFEGAVKEALFSLFKFYYKVNKEKKRYKPMNAPMLANSFMTAAVAIDRMPGWLRREFVLYLIAVERGGRKQEFPVPPKVRKEVRELIEKGLPKGMLLGGRVPVPKSRKKRRS
ncbi:MAG: helix-turn-helix transcriptional regulator [Pyrinomonadaceae bacterium]